MYSVTVVDVAVNINEDDDDEDHDCVFFISLDIERMCTFVPKIYSRNLSPHSHSFTLVCAHSVSRAPFNLPKV